MSYGVRRAIIHVRGSGLVGGGEGENAHLGILPTARSRSICIGFVVTLTSMIASIRVFWARRVLRNFSVTW